MMRIEPTYAVQAVCWGGGLRTVSAVKFKRNIRTHKSIDPFIVYKHSKPREVVRAAQGQKLSS